MHVYLIGFKIIKISYFDSDKNCFQVDSLKVVQRIQDGITQTQRVRERYKITCTQKQTYVETYTY